jgi:hypothetical protein
MREQPLEGHPLRAGATEDEGRIVLPRQGTLVHSQRRDGGSHRLRVRTKVKSLA